MDADVKKRVEKMKEYASIGKPFYLKFSNSWFSDTFRSQGTFRVSGDVQNDNDGNYVVPVDVI